jgi:predicted transcriptional regulator
MKDIVVRTLKAAQKPLRAVEIAELSGISKKDVDKAVSELKKEDKIFSPIRCYYDLKK